MDNHGAIMDNHGQSWSYHVYHGYHGQILGREVVTQFPRMFRTSPGAKKVCIELFEKISSSLTRPRPRGGGLETSFPEKLLWDHENPMQDEIPSLRLGYTHAF
jgi:hypothetical protein